MASPEFVPLEARHWESVRAIYLEGVATGQATFQTDAPSWPAWDQGHHPHSRLLLFAGPQVIGWAALSPVSTRPAYAGVAEVSIYITASRRGQGLGRLLLHELIRCSEASGIWTLQASIFPENLASVALHTRAGFRIVGEREKLGRLHGHWRNVLLLERRSPLSQFA